MNKKDAYEKYMRAHIGDACIQASTLAMETYMQHSHEIAQMAAILVDCLKAGGKVLVCGNGGSACDAMHFAEELTGRYQKDRKALPAIALTDAAHITCVANDFGFGDVFSRSVAALGKAGDVMIVLSTSGNSGNIENVMVEAFGKLMGTIALLGKGGGHINGLADAELIVPSQDSARIQEVHMLVLHILVETIEREMFPENYAKP
jgi:D-sedoheptulose 7-phosphate isomerase